MQTMTTPHATVCALCMPAATACKHNLVDVFLRWTSATCQSNLLCPVQSRRSHSRPGAPTIDTPIKHQAPWCIRMLITMRTVLLLLYITPPHHAAQHNTSAVAQNRCRLIPPW
jgi:hypothetical protein